MASPIQQGPAVSLSGVVKAFEGVRALDHASLSLRPGEVHALAGANGAGKSTLVKVLTGVERPDEGELHAWGNSFTAAGHWPTPSEAITLGIAVVHQEFSLLPELTVAENVFLGRLPKGTWRGISWRNTHQQTRTILETLGLQVDPRTEVRRLSVAQQQLIEIAKAVSQPGERLLILDEPSAVLAGRSLTLLFEAVTRLRDAGVSVLYISHRLEELLTLSDRVTVLKDGVTVVQAPVSELDERSLIEAMVGRRLHSKAKPTQVLPRDTRRVALRVRDLTTRDGLLQNLSLHAYAGEILGLAGLVGSGRSRLLHAIFGDIPLSDGTIEIDGRAKRPGIASAIANGVGLVPEDRKILGLIHTRDIRFNITLASLKKLSSWGFMRKSAEVSLVADLVQRLAIKCRQDSDSVMTLSGGTQQKTLVARWLAVSPRILLLDEPTRGIDVATRADIYEIVRELAAQGMTLIIASSDSRELCEICQRVLIIRSHRLVDEVAGPDLTREHIDTLATQRATEGR